MFENLHAHILARVDLKPDEWEFIQGKFIEKKFKKKQFLLQEGQVNHDMFFIEKGCLRLYTVNEKAEEHILSFGIEGWWIGDMHSFLTGEKSMYNIEALEDSTILTLDFDSQEQIFKEIPIFERYMRLLLQKNFISMHRRLVSTISTSAEEKYLRMVKTYPDIVQRVPQHMIASYLGLKPETLSRIRKKLSLEK
jgi:CRP-like cAMP-binding protein